MRIEEIIIVDEFDNIIWYKNKSDILSEDIYRATWLWIENSSWDILLAQRSFSKKNDPWKWWPAVAWTVEKWESYESNIIKEAWEEIWLFDFEFEKLEIIRFYWQFNYFAQLFKTITEKQIEDFIIQESEIEQLKWIRRDVLIQELKKNPEKFVPAIDKAVKIT